MLKDIFMLLLSSDFSLSWKNLGKFLLENIGEICQIGKIL